MKASTNNAVLDAAQPFLNAGIELGQIGAALENLRQKKEILKHELSEIDERLVTCERSRPALLEAVLSGAEQESVLTKQEMMASQLGAEHKSKTDLLELIERQLEEKSAKKTKLRDWKERMRDPIFRAIQKDLLDNTPEGFCEHLKQISTVSQQVSGRGFQVVLEELVPPCGHDARKALLKGIFERYGVAE